MLRCGARCAVGVRVAERYDAAIIGAGADGLAAAAVLARAGLSTIVLEREATAGGRLATREFHPGYFATPCQDAIAPIPDDLFHALELARHGAWAAPEAPSVALWSGRAPVHGTDQTVWREASRRRAAALAHARAPGPPTAPRWNPFAQTGAGAWPEEPWRFASLRDALKDLPPDAVALAAAVALEGRGADPLAAGSALHLVTTPESRVWRGALGGLGAALAAAARAAGAEIALGQEVSEIKGRDGRVTALLLSDGVEIAAPAVISTLDLKRTFLALFPWSALDKSVVKAVGDFRMAGATARLLVALSERPSGAGLGAPPRGPVHVAPDLAALSEAHAQWRAGVLAERLPLTLRFASATDPGLAPIGSATMTVTIGCVPFVPFDGAWTNEKRVLLTKRVLTGIEDVFPGLSATVVATELLLPPDIEKALGATNGDLWGGAQAPDQMFALRPGFARGSPYTPVAGLYLAGPSAAAAPFGTCVAGAVAAQALLAERRG